MCVCLCVGLSTILIFLHLAYESAVRDQRMRTEMSQAKRETRFYLESVDKQKEFSAIEQRKRKRGQETEVCVEHTYQFRHCCPIGNGDLPQITSLEG